MPHAGRWCTAGLFWSTLLAAACSGDSAEHARQLLETDRAFARLSASSGPKEAFAAYLAPDAIMIPRAGEPAHGREAALATFGAEPAFGLQWQPQQAEVAASGDLGWTWGTYQILLDGQPTARGKYVNIWKKQADGSWKVRLDMGNLEPGSGSARGAPGEGGAD